MSLDRLLKQAEYFEKLSQQDPYDSNLRNLVVNTRPDGRNFSFREVVDVVLQDLTSLDRSEKDPEVSQASHGLLNILNSLEVPDPNAMLNAAKAANNVIQQRYANDAEKTKIAKYLVSLTQIIINKYFTQKSTDTSGGDVTTEGTYVFLQRIFNTLHSGQSLNENDANEWKNSRTFYVRRLNGLNSLPNLTPSQQNEKQLIEFVISKLH